MVDNLQMYLETDFSEQLLDIYKLYNDLYDEESKLVFQGRYLSSIKQNDSMLFEKIKLLNKNYSIPELTDFLRINSFDCNKIIIYGSGFDLYYSLWLLVSCGIMPKFLVDITGTSEKREWMVPVITHQELLLSYQDYVVVIASSDCAFDIYKKLLYCKFPRNKILCPRRGVLEGMWGNQYFDFFKHAPGDREVFVDCGAFDGTTSIEFLNWCNGEYEKIFIFEMDQSNIKICKRNISKYELRNCKLVEGGVWSNTTKLLFDEGNFTSSSISETGTVERCVYALDTILEKEKVTFIKMDIEGAELEAIKGARSLIEKNKPKLAISVYHKPEDIVDIPLLLRKIVPDYKFCLRHYRSSRRETVLYAFIEGDR